MPKNDPLIDIKRLKNIWTVKDGVVSTNYVSVEEIGCKLIEYTSNKSNNETYRSGRNIRMAALYVSMSPEQRSSLKNFVDDPSNVPDNLKIYTLPTLKNFIWFIETPRMIEILKALYDTLKYFKTNATQTINEMVVQESTLPTEKSSSMAKGDSETTTETTPKSP